MQEGVKRSKVDKVSIGIGLFAIALFVIFPVIELLLKENTTNATIFETLSAITVVYRTASVFCIILSCFGTLIGIWGKERNKKINNIQFKFGITGLRLNIFILIISLLIMHFMSNTLFMIQPSVLP